MRLKIEPLAVMRFVLLLIAAGCAAGGGGGDGGGGGGAPPPPPVSGGTLSLAAYAGTQSPGDWWTWTSSSNTLTGVDATSTVDLGTLTATDQGNGYYALSNSNYSAFALAQANFLGVLPVSGSNTTPLALNPIFTATPDPCVANGTATFNVVNFTNTAHENNQFFTMPQINATATNGSATITSLTFNGITINMTGLTCSGEVWMGSNGLRIIGSDRLLIGDLGTNTSTGFPAGTTGFIGVRPLSQPISLTTLNQAHFLLADATPTTANTTNPGAGRFIKAGVLGGTNTKDNFLYVYTYGGCQAAAAGQTYPISSNTPSAVGDYVWSLDQGGNVGIQYHVPTACGFGGTYGMYMGRLANGKLIGLPQYLAVSGNIGAPILIEE